MSVHHETTTPRMASHGGHQLSGKKLPYLCCFVWSQVAGDIEDMFVFPIFGMEKLDYDANETNTFLNFRGWYTGEANRDVNNDQAKENTECTRKIYFPVSRPIFWPRNTPLRTTHIYIPLVLLKNNSLFFQLANDPPRDRVSGRCLNIYGSTITFDPYPFDVDVSSIRKSSFERNESSGSLLPLHDFCILRTFSTPSRA